MLIALDVGAFVEVTADVGAFVSPVTKVEEKSVEAELDGMGDAAVEELATEEDCGGKEELL